MLLTGTFRRSIDEKQRVSIPKRLRTAIESEGATALYLAPGTDESLAIYPEKAFSQLADRLSEVSPTGTDVRAFSRMFFARAERVEMDAQGRVRVPPELFQLAGLNQEVVMVGVRDHVEIRDAAKWDEYLSQRQTSYDDIAEKAFGS